MAVDRAKLHELRRTKQTLKNEYKAIVAKEDELPAGDTLPAEDTDRLGSIETELTALDGRIARIETALEMDGGAADPVDSPDAGGDDKGYTVDADGRYTPHGYGEKQSASAIANDPLKGKGFGVARFALGVVMAKGGAGMSGAAAFIERRFGDKVVARALNTAGVATGGALIPQDFANELIELLRAETVIRKLNPVRIPMPLGNLTIPRLAGGATAGFQGELDDMTASQETFDDLQLNAKKLTALVPVSNDLIRRAPIGVEAIVRDDLIQTVGRREDLADMLGDGSGGSVIGLLNLCAAASKITYPVFAATDNATVFNAVNALVVTLKLLLKQNMSRMIRPAWIMAPGTESFLSGLINQFGNFPYKEEMMAGKLEGVPYAVSQQLPTNITAAGGGNNGGYIFLVDFADVILAETMNVMVDASDVASYKDGGGNSVSTFTRDQTAFRIIEEYDFQIRHQASVAVAVVPGWLPAGYTANSGMAFYYQAPSGDASAAASTWGVAAPSGSSNPGNVSANVAGGLLPGRP
jgi:HK97 family phage major capsid protein